MKTYLLLKYLRAATIFGPSANPFTGEFCLKNLKIDNVDEALEKLRTMGFSTTVNERGEILLEA